MAQERWWNWLDDDSTFRLNSRDLIMIPFGLYSGFDKKAGTGMVLTLTHTINPKTKVNQDLTESNPLGVWKSKQGVVIAEDANITLNIDTGHPTFARIDTIVGEHEYVEAEGGSFATYKVVKGIPSNQPIPPLVSSNKQVVLGTLLVPANCVDLDTSTWVKSRIPNPFTDDTIMHTDLVQTSTALKVFNVQRGEMVFTTVNGGVLDTSIDSNFYYINSLGSERYYDLNSLSKKLTGAGQIVWLYSKSGLRIENNVQFIIPEGYTHIEAGTVFGIMCISSTGTSSKYVLVDHGFLNKSATHSKVRGLIAGNKGVADVSDSNVIITNNTAKGNFLSVKAGNTIRSIDSIANLPINPNANQLSEAGCILYLSLELNTLLEHNLNPLVARGKKLWIPTEANISLKAGTIVMLIEDNNHWRVLSIWNKDLSVLTLALPTRLEDLSNVTTQLNAGKTVIHHVVRSTGDGNWESVSLKNWVEDLNLKMNKTFEQAATVFNNIQYPNTPISNAEGVVHKLELTADHGNVIIFDFNVDINKTIAYLPNTFKIGTVLEFIMINKGFKFYTGAGAGGNGLIGYLPIYRLGAIDYGEFTPKVGSPFRLIRLADRWLFVDANHKANWSQSNRNAPDYIDNKPNTFGADNLTTGIYDANMYLKIGDETIATASRYNGLRFKTDYVIMGNRASSNNISTLINDWTKNVGYVYPPTGFSINDFRGCIPSIGEIHVAGDMDGNDSWYCKWQIQANNGRIAVICNNSENRANAWANVLTIWYKI